LNIMSPIMLESEKKTEAFDGSVWVRNNVVRVPKLIPPMAPGIGFGLPIKEKTFESELLDLGNKTPGSGFVDSIKPKPKK
jgi:hypothetical protein